MVVVHVHKFGAIVLDYLNACKNAVVRGPTGETVASGRKRGAGYAESREAYLSDAEAVTKISRDILKVDHLLQSTRAPPVSLEPIDQSGTPWAQT